MATRRKQFTAGSISAGDVASSRTRPLLTGASVIALQAMLAAGAANAATCVTTISTTTGNAYTSLTTNGSAIQADTFLGSIVPFTASNFTAVTGGSTSPFVNSVTGGNSGATDNGNPDATACGTNANADGAQASAYGSDSNANGSSATALGTFANANGNFATATGGGSVANGGQSTATGTTAFANGAFASAYGVHANANGDHSTATGASSYRQRLERDCDRRGPR